MLPGSVDPATVETNMVYADTDAVGLDSARDDRAAAGPGRGSDVRVRQGPDGHARRRRRRRARPRPGCVANHRGPRQRRRHDGPVHQELPRGDRRPHPAGQRLVKTWPVLHYGPIPTFDGTNWDLEVSGLVEHPFTLSYAELQALPHVTVDADMHCVTGWTTLDNTWEGVSFRTLLEMAKPTDEAKWVIAHCAHGYTSNLSLQAMSDDDVLVAWKNHGEDLTAEHGWPLRLVVPKRYAWKSAKWLTGLEFSAKNKRGLLGGPGLPHPRRAVRRGALQLPGGPARRAGAVTEGLDLEAYLARIGHAGGLEPDGRDADRAPSGARAVDPVREPGHPARAADPAGSGEPAGEARRRPAGRLLLRAERALRRRPRASRVRGHGPGRARDDGRGANDAEDPHDPRRRHRRGRDGWRTSGSAATRCWIRSRSTTTEPVRQGGVGVPAGRGRRRPGPVGPPRRRLARPLHVHGGAAAARSTTRSPTTTRRRGPVRRSSRRSSRSDPGLDERWMLIEDELRVERPDGTERWTVGIERRAAVDPGRTVRAGVPGRHQFGRD